MVGVYAWVAMSLVGRSYTWQDIVQPNFKDCTFEAKVISANEKELKKISRDFAASFKFTFIRAQVKEPFMVRLESKVEGTDIQYIENGGRRMERIPKVNFRRIEDVSHAPGKRQTVLDFGVLTPSLFDSLYDANFVRVDRETNDLVFDLTYKHPEFTDTSRQRVWVDPQKRYITKRVWFAQDGHEMATFIYQDPKEQSSVWFPSEATVKDVDGEVAGVTRYSKMNINVGLSTQPFQF
jgi:outer membrane lipoprotein-sorting protein